MAEETIGTGIETKMAAIRLPEQLSLGDNSIKNWKLFRQRWETYSIITDLEKLHLNKQKAIFLHCLSDDALEAYNTFEAASTSSLNDIIESFENFITGETNETYERFIFNQRNQEQGEKFELFYADLQRLIKSCNYCNKCRNSILKDRIVLGISDTSIQKELLKIRDLTIDKTIDICKASNATMDGGSETKA